MELTEEQLNGIYDALWTLEGNMQSLRLNVGGGEIQAGMRSGYPDQQEYLMRDIKDMQKCLAVICEAVDMDDPIMNR